MFKVSREQQGKTLLLRLSGIVSEAVDMSAQIGETTSDTVVNCKEITRINSIGAKAWIQFFEERSSKGSRFRFAECSPSVVEQLNLIMNFVAGGEVESIYVPFVCTQKSCRKSMIGLFTVKDLKSSHFEISPVECKKCGAQAIFDEIADEYFQFAKRRTARVSAGGR